MSNELVNLPVEKLAPLIKNKDISSYEITEATLNRAERNNPTINAYIDITRDKALKMATEADKDISKGIYHGMFHGIPLGIKDNIYLKNEKTTMGSKIHKDFIPNYNATVINKLKNSRAVFLGKLNMHEYAHGPTNNNPHFGPCRNPWNLKKIPGSSSGGSGAAVISGMASASLGTDTGGSIRIPASSCGIVGLKPTHGRVSKYGVFPLAWSLDHIGPMTKTVKDAAGLMEVISGYDVNDSSSLNVTVDNYLSSIENGVKDLVIGINEDYFFNKVDSRIEKIIKKEIKSLEKQGANIKIVKLPAMKYSEYALMTTLIAEPSTVHHQELIKQGENFGEDVRTLLKLGELIPAVDYLQAQKYRNLVKQDFKNIFKEIDLLITPTTPFTAPFIGDSHAYLNGDKVDLNDEVVRFTGPGNLTGLPSLSIPCGLIEGMPVGLQIIGDAFDESTVLQVGRVIEKNVNFSSLVHDFNF